MNKQQTDADWEFFGSKEPYWAVLTHDEFRKDNLTQETKEKFFQSGEGYIEQVFTTVKKWIDPHFTPQRSLDFGCGVGRLLLPIAKRCSEAVGLDVSKSMLAEAKSMCEKQNVTNIELILGDDSLSGLTGMFDFINSFIVFQHIPCVRGEKIFSILLSHLNRGGVGVLHFTYSKSSYLHIHEKVWPSINASTSPEIITPLKYHLYGITTAVKKSINHVRSKIKNFITSPQKKLPTMQMNPYVLNRIFQILQSSNIKTVHSEFTDHGGELGVLLYFQKE